MIQIFWHSRSYDHDGLGTKHFNTQILLNISLIVYRYLDQMMEDRNGFLRKKSFDFVYKYCTYNCICSIISVRGIFHMWLIFSHVKNSSSHTLYVMCRACCKSWDSSQSNYDSSCVILFPLWILIRATGGSLKNPTTLHNELKLIVKRIDNHVDFIYKYVSCHV